MVTDIASDLATHFGFTSFRPGQAEAIHSLLNGQHTLAVMPTGSGKSLIYQLAALNLPGTTLVISPLIALMKDQVDGLERRGIPATFINSSLLSSEQSRRLKGLKSGAYRLVFIAPERLRSTNFIAALRSQTISLLAVDEAHCISEWGHDFRPDYLYIGQFRANLGDPVTAALTATATPQVQKDIARLLNLSPMHTVVTGFNRPNLALEVRYVKNPAGRLNALQGLLGSYRDGGTIIYTGTRRDAEEAADFVRSVLGFPAQHYHAGLPADERSRIQDQFMLGDLSIVVATNAFGMGIDRPDVRQVIHFSLPGSLEAYYQEAGRAGRDELPARAVLLYSPEDRALQEFFIDSSIINERNLNSLHDAIHSANEKHRAITIEDISFLTGMQEIQVRVGMSELERAGILEHIEDDRLRMRIKLNDWNEREIQQVIERHHQHQAHRRRQLARMIDYAESNACRRRIILNHFGDAGPAEAEFCCDNCQARQAVLPPLKELAALSQSEKAALIVLDCIRRLQWDIGKEKIAQILKGSKARDILRYGYNKHVYYGKLAVFSITEIKLIIEQLLEMDYIKVIGGEYPVLRLTPQGEAAIKQKTAISLNLPRHVTNPEIENKKAERQAGGTLEYTAELLAAGLNVEQVAARRGLSPVTIYNHAAKLIMAGRISVDDVLPNNIKGEVEAAIQQAGSVEYLYPIKILLPDDIGYEVIRCVIEGWKRNEKFESSFITSPKTDEKSVTDSIRPGAEDTIANFLSRTHPRQLPGPWASGWALGFHSQFSGAEWKRSNAGELAYRLKYQDDLTVLPELVEQAAALIAEHPALGQVDAIVPVPPSVPRAHDPVSSFAKALSQRLGLVYWPVLVKARHTTPQKELHTLAQKRKNVDGAFDNIEPVIGKRVLIVDDLFDSGATLHEIYRLLHRLGAKEVCVLTLTRTIHSDS